MSYETLQASETDLTRPPPSYPEKLTYERLCREPTVYPDEIKPQLKCFYWHGKHMDSSIVWAPIKTEILYPDPLVVQFYDIISDDESEQIRKFATRQLKRSVVHLYLVLLLEKRTIVRVPTTIQDPKKCGSEIPL